MTHQRNFWIPVICGAIILTIGIGARQSFGIFQKPIAADLNVGRELWSFSNALALLLMGVFAPFAGNLADRFGTAPTVGAGSALYVTGMLMIAMAGEGVMLTVGNALAGIGMAAAGFGPILGAIGRQTPAEWRSSALGIATAGGSFGQFAIVPFASILQNRLDNWHSTMFVLAAVSVMMVPSRRRTARESRGTFKGRRCAPASKQQGCAARSISHSGLLAAHDRFLCVRFPCDIYRFAPPILHLRQLRRPVVLWAADIRD